MAGSIYEIPFQNARGETTSLAPYEDQVLLIVNTATLCGFATQFQGLERLHRRYGGQGLRVLGFPCNQFAGQEPGEGEAIAQTCLLNHGVTFPLFAKIDVNGPGAHPLYRHLKRAKRGLLFNRRIEWNFAKFLVDRKGRVVKRFSPIVKPERIERHIRRLLER